MAGMKWIAFAALALGACEMEPAAEKQPAGEAEAVVQPAANKAEEGKLSIKAPGFNLEVGLPEGVNHSSDENEIIYPGARMSGLHVEAAGGEGKADGVEFRFTSTDAPDKIAAWYRDPARAKIFSITDARREGETLLLAGKEAEDGDPFTLRIDPRGGGSEARLSLSDRK